MGWGWELSGKENEEPIWKCCILTLGGGYQGSHDYWNLSKWGHFTVCQFYFSKKGMKQERSWVKGSMVSWRCCFEQLRVKLWWARCVSAPRGCPQSQNSRRRDPQWKGERVRDGAWGAWTELRTGCYRESGRGFSWDEWTHFESYASWIADGDHCPGWGLAGHGGWNIWCSLRVHSKWVMARG